MRLLSLALLLLNLAASAGAQPEILPALDDFQSLPPAEPGEWRTTHRESEQGLRSFVLSGPLKPSQIRIVPIGCLPEDLPALVSYLECYYPHTQVEIAPVETAPPAVRTRQGKLSSNDLLASLHPTSSCLVLGLTSYDIYEETVKGHHPLFGEAPYNNPRALASTARLGNANPDLYRARLFKLVTHEINHALGMRHCAAYRCVMNGCSSLEEVDKRPPYLCPQDLAKLQQALDFDIGQRYRALYTLHRKGTGLKAVAPWYGHRLRSLGNFFSRGFRSFLFHRQVGGYPGFP